MAVAATVAVDLIARTDQFAKAMKDAASKADEVGKTLTDLGASLSAKVTAPLVAAGGAAFLLATDAAESASKMEAVFGEATGRMNEWVSDLRRTVPATTAEIQNMASGIQDLLVPLGLAPELAAEMTKQVVTLSADLASFNNLPVKDVLASIQSGLVGSYQPLLKFGVALNQATVNAKALEMGLIAEREELNANARAQAVFQLLLAGTTAAHGDAAKTAQGAANQLKFLWANAKEAATVFGGQLVPILTPVIQRLNSMVESLSRLSPAQQAVTLAVGAFAAAVPVAILLLGKLLQGYASLLTEGPKVVAAFGKLAQMIQTGVIPAIVRLNAVLLANPIGLVIAALAALTAAFVYVYQRSETFREVIHSTFPLLVEFATFLRDGVGAVLTWLGAKFETIFGGIQDTIASFVGGAVKFIGRILPDGVAEGMQRFSDSMTTRVRSAVDTTKQIISELRAPSLDLGVTGSNAAAKSALYGPIIEASNEAGQVLTGSAGAVAQAQGLQAFAGVKLRDSLAAADTELRGFNTTVRAVQQSNRATIDSLLEGARLQTLNSRELEMLTGVQASLRAELESGNLSLARRNELTNQLNQTTEALNSVQQQTTSAFAALKEQGLAELGKFFGQLSPASIALSVLSEVLKPLQPIIESLKQPFMVLGQIVGKALLPILKAFWPVVRGLAIAMSYVAEVIFRVAGGLASAVGGAIAAIGGVIAKIPFLGGIGRSIQESGRNIQEIGRGFTQAGKDMKSLREELRNIDINGEEQDVTAALLTEGNDLQARTASNTERIADAMEEQASMPPANITINITGGGDDAQTLAARVAEEIDRVLGRTTARDNRLDGAVIF
jgi:phage-related protein